MYSSFKRICDFLTALIATIILLPFMLPIILLLKCTGEGYIFYLQERVGYKNKKFFIYKFATMLKDSPNMKGGIITTKGDPRFTPLGPFLRKSKINELPQLINILRGDMSIVGPRPVMQKSFNAYPTDVQNEIYNVKPGLTGIGSVVFRDEESLINEVKEAGKDPWAFYSETIYPFKGKLEKWYQRHYSIQTDLLILFSTTWVIIFPSSNIIYKIFKDLPQRPY